MKNLLEEPEPRLKLEGKKEVNRKKNKNLSQLIVYLKNEKDKNKQTLYVKAIEEEIKTEIKYLGNNSTQTKKVFGLTNTLDIDEKQLVFGFQYNPMKENFGFSEKKPKEFYEIGSSYSFMPRIKEEKREEEQLLESKKQEEKETTYLMYNPDEESEEENELVLNQKV
jgi:hypothetical protein